MLDLMATCQVERCGRDISKPGHTLCYDHWLAKQSGEIRSCAKCGRLKEDPRPLCDSCYRAGKSSEQPAVSSEQTLSSTKIGEHFSSSPKNVNLVLAELGWIQKAIKGWEPTALGQRLGAQRREAQQNGAPYVVWPTQILSNRHLRGALSDEADQGTAPPVVAPPPPPSVPPEEQDFRLKYPAKFRTSDGHYVRSRGEQLIDNWLYNHDIVHAYERRATIEADLLCDFWIPRGQVYVEFWGIESNERYAARKATKQKLYRDANLRLIEIENDHLNNLDDYLTKMLIRFNVDVP